MLAGFSWLALLDSAMVRDVAWRGVHRSPNALQNLREFRGKWELQTPNLESDASPPSPVHRCASARIRVATWQRG